MENPARPTDAMPPLPWRSTIGGRMVLSIWLLFTCIWVTTQMAELYGLPGLDHAGWIQHFRNEEFLRLNASANDRKQHLEDWLRERRAQLALAAQGHALIAGLAGGKGRSLDAAHRDMLTNWLQVVRDSAGPLDAVVLFDARGRWLADDGGSQDLRQLPEALVAQVGLAGVDEALAIRYDRPLQRPLLDMVRKIALPGAEGNVVFLMVTLDIEEELRSRYEAQLTDLLGGTAEMLLIDPDRHFVVATKFPLNTGLPAVPLTSRDESEVAGLAVNGGEGHLLTQDYRGEPVLAAYRYLRITPEVGWGLIVKKDEREAMAVLKKQIMTFAVVAGLGNLALVLLALLIARQLTRPLARMVEAARSIGEGHWEARAPVEGRSEVAQLALTFNAMAERIADWHRSLDREVSVKTQQILDQEGRMLAIGEATTDGIVTVDEDSRITYWNPAAERIFGYPAAEVMGRRVHDLLAPSSHRKMADQAFAAYAEGGGGGAFNRLRELPALTRDGRTLTIELTISPLVSRGARHAVGTFRDVTERKHRENALRFIAEQLSVKVGDEYFQSLAQTLGELVQADLVLVGELTHDGAMALLPLGRFSRAAQPGDRDYPVAHTPYETTLADGFCLIDGGCGRRFPGGEMSGFGAYAGCALSDKRGYNLGVVAIFWQARLPADMDLKAYLRIFAARAGAELERLQAERRLAEHLAGLENTIQERTRALQSSNEELGSALQLVQKAQHDLVESEKLASLGSLVAGIAHELNTPIGNSLTVSTALAEKITQFCTLITSGQVRRSDLNAFTEEMLQGANLLARSLQRSAELIQDFKQVAVDQTSSQRRQFKLREVLEEMQAVLHPRFKKTRHRLDLAVPEDLALDSYPGPLGQVISNLVQNALVHGFEHCDNGTITIQAERSSKAGQVRISIIDDGCGMAPGVLDRVFEPFFTTKLGQGGSGLGMHITYNLVTGVLGGKINIESQAGRGTTVVLDLPMTAPEPLAEAAT